MVDSVFGNLNRDKTVEAMKEYLGDYQKWKMKALRRFPTVGSPNIDGQPHGTSYDHDKQFVNYAEAKFQMLVREKCCENLKTISEDKEELGDLLMYRYIKGYGRVKTMNKLIDQYGYMDDSTFSRKQRRALYEAAMICPDDSVRVAH